MLRVGKMNDQAKFHFFLSIQIILPFPNIFAFGHYLSLSMATFWQSSTTPSHVTKEEGNKLFNYYR